MKANEESKTRKLWKTMHKVVLVDFLKINRLFLRFNRLFLSAVNKKQLKTNICKIREKENHTNNLILVHSYTKSYILSPENHRVSTMQSKSRLQTHHQRSDLEHLKTHTSFGKHTTKFRTTSDSAYTSNIQKYKRYIKDYT